MRCRLIDGPLHGRAVAQPALGYYPDPRRGYAPEKILEDCVEGIAHYEWDHRAADGVHIYKFTRTTYSSPY